MTLPICRFSHQLVRAQREGIGAERMTDQTALTIIRNLLAICERFKTPSGHLDHREAIDFRGVCVGHLGYVGTGETVKDGSGFREVQRLAGTCAPSCQHYQTWTTAAREHVAANEPRQLGLIEGAA